MLYHYYVGYLWSDRCGFSTSAMEVLRDRPVTTFQDALGVRDFIAEENRISGVTVLGISLLRTEPAPDPEPAPAGR